MIVTEQAREGRTVQNPAYRLIRHFSMTYGEFWRNCAVTLAEAFVLTSPRSLVAFDLPYIPFFTHWFLYAPHQQINPARTRLAFAHSFFGVPSDSTQMYFPHGVTF